MAKKKRGNSEGSVFRRKSGQWYAQVSYRGLDGRTKYLTRQAESERHARMLLKELQTRNVRLTPASGPVTVDRFLESWLSAHIATTKSKATSQNYRLTSKNWIVPMLGSIKLHDLNPLQVTEWILAMEQNGTPRPTMRRAYAVLSTSMQYAMKMQLLDRNPCAPVERPKIDAPEIHPFGKDEVSKILADREGDRLFSLYLLAFSTGMRQGELFALRVRDLDLEARTIMVMQSSSEAEGQHIKETKTRSGKRKISITERTADALRERLAIMMREGAAGTGLVFTSSRQTVIRQSNFRNRHWKPLLQRLVIPYRGFHHVRHTAATEMLRRGVQIKVVSAILGHANIETTLSIYSHWIPDDMSNAANTMENFGMVTDP